MKKEEKNLSTGIQSGCCTSEASASLEMFYRIRIYNSMKAPASDSIVTVCHFCHLRHDLRKSIHDEDLELSTLQQVTPIFDIDQKRASIPSIVHTDRAISKVRGY